MLRQAQCIVTVVADGLRVVVVWLFTSVTGWVTDLAFGGTHDPFWVVVQQDRTGACVRMCVSVCECDYVLLYS